MLTFGDPLRFYANIFFWTKMLMIALTGINAMAFEYVTQDTVPEWDAAPITPYAAPGSPAAVSLRPLVRHGHRRAGRLIPYNWFA